MITQLIDVPGRQHDQVAISLEHAERSILVLSNKSVTTVCKGSKRTYLFISIVNELRANRVEKQSIHEIREKAAISDDGNVHRIARGLLLENHEQAQYEANGQWPKAQLANHRAPDQAKSNSFPKRKK